MKNFVVTLAYAILLVTVLPAYSQNSLPKKEIKLFFEKVYLHTDRNVYAPSDDIWFKAYLVNAQDNKLLNTSRNLYVELITPGGKVTIHNIIALKDGLANGDFKLPDSLAAGNYRIRAYTNWMRNFGNNFIFEKEITIVNNTTTVSGKTATIIPITTSFFPEGGSLVEGISSLVAVKAENADGQGLAVKGAVLSASGDTVARFTTDTLGMGMFTLLPLPGQTYQARVNYKANSYPTNLPPTLKSGLALKTYKKDTTLYAVVSCNEQALNTYAPQTLTIKVRSFGRVTYQQMLQLKGNAAAVVIPTSQMPTGIASITLYDGQLKPNCERLIYIDNPQNARLTVNLIKSSYKQREQVVVDVKTTDKQGNPLNTDFSLAAVDAALVPAEESNILAYLMLQSELKGTVKYASRYFDSTNVQRNKQLDLLLMTQGWRDFVWKRLADTALRITYIPEQGISLSGNVQQAKQAIPVAGANITLIAPKATNGRLFAAQANAQGKYYFDNLQLYGPQSVRLNSKDVKGKPLGLISLDSLATNYPPIEKSPYFTNTAFTLSTTNTAALLKQVTLSKQRSLTDTLIKLKEVQVKKQNQQVLRDRTVTTFGYKDEVLTVKPDDLRYNTLRDYIQFASKQAHVDAETNRLYFVADGRKITPRIILNNRDALFNDNDPDDVIDLISNSYYDLPVSAVDKVIIKKLVGSQSLLVENPDGSAAVAAAANPGKVTTSSNMLGIVFAIYITLKPDALKKQEPGATQAEINGYYEARTFYKPIYNVPKPEVKLDVRATLHWEPNGKTSNDGHASVSFYNSDSKTTVRLIIQGITSTGIPVTAIKNYSVK